MSPADLTDKLLLDLHVQQLTSVGQASESIRARAGAAWRLSKFLDPKRNTWLDCAKPRALIEATPADLVAWQASLHLSKKTIRCYVSEIQAFYSWLVRPMRVIDDSPAEDLRKPRVPRREPRPVPEEELEFALEMCVDREIKAWLVLGGYAGLRSVDISMLDKDAVILDEGSRPLLRLIGKGDNEARIAVGLLVVQVLAPFAGRGRGPMFSRNGRRVKRQDVERLVNEYLHSIGLESTFHQWRHRYGTQIYRLTKDLLYTKNQLRHASVTSTQIYALADPEVNVGAVDALDSHLSKLKVVVR